MPWLPTVLSIATVAISVVIALCVLVFLLASGANSTPAQIRELKIMCWSLVLASVLGVGAMIWLLILKRPWWSLVAASEPGAFALIMLVMLFIRGDRGSSQPPDGFTRSHISQPAMEEPVGNKGDEYNARKEAEHKAFLSRVDDLESRNELEAMEKAIRAHNDTLWSCCHIADMYRRRMNRLKAAGDIAGAEEAFAKSYDWMCSFASGATSGGEGAANSLARDEYLQRLVDDLGYLPKAVTPWNS